MNDLVKQFQESISRISEEEFMKVWDELKEYNEIGPIAVEYVEQALCKIDCNQIGFNLIVSKIKSDQESDFGQSDSCALAA